LLGGVEQEHPAPGVWRPEPAKRCHLVSFHNVDGQRLSGDAPATVLRNVDISEGPVLCNRSASAERLLSGAFIEASPKAFEAGVSVQGGQVSNFETVDFFTDASLIEDPYPYFEYLRSKGPVVREPHHAVIAVLGYDEAVAIYRDNETFSSCNSVIGPFHGLPVQSAGDDISEVLELHRGRLPMNEHMVTMDPPEHTAQRALLMRLITPKRLRENEAFMWRLADRQLDEFIAKGKCEFIAEYSQPFAVQVIADLLGVPEEDHRLFRVRLGLQSPPGAIGRAEEERFSNLNSLAFLDGWFTSYIEERRREPRHDVLTDLALARFPDGATPEVVEVVRTATFLFAAGQETTARLLASALKCLAENPHLQQLIRGNRGLIPNFIEETLRIESPVKCDCRLARRTTRIAGVEIPAGTTIMLLNGAANRDPRRFESPAEFRIDRPNANEHIAFGRGAHACPGGPLARVEARVSLERIFDRMGDIRLSEAEHGPLGARRFQYAPTYVLRGLSALHLEFTPMNGA
jgi:cytochrome P450